MNVRAILERNVGGIVGQLVVLASNLEASNVAKDVEIARLKSELEAMSKKRGAARSASASEKK